MSLKWMKRLQTALIGIGLAGVMFTAMVAGDDKGTALPFKQYLFLMLIGVFITGGGLIGGQLLANHIEYIEKQDKLKKAEAIKKEADKLCKKRWR